MNGKMKLLKKLNWLVIGTMLLAACGPGNPVSINPAAAQPQAMAQSVSPGGNAGASSSASQTAEAANETLSQDPPPVDQGDQTVLAQPLDKKKSLRKACDAQYELSLVLDLSNREDLATYLGIATWMKANCQEWYSVTWDSSSGRIEIKPKGDNKSAGAPPPGNTPTAGPNATPGAKPNPTATTSADEAKNEAPPIVGGNTKELQNACLALYELSAVLSKSKSPQDAAALIELAHLMEEILGCKQWYTIVWFDDIPSITPKPPVKKP